MSATKAPSSHPTYASMVTAAIVERKDRHGTSRQAIHNLIKSKYNLGDGSTHHLRTCLKKMLASGQIELTKGTGLSGSFKLKKAVAAKPTAQKNVAPKKTVAKKAAPKKKPASKTSPKKTVAKKTSKKIAVKKTPKKKPAAKKSVKKTITKKATKKPQKKVVKKSKK